MTSQVNEKKESLTYLQENETFKKIQQRKRLRKAIGSTIQALIVIAAIAVLLSTLWIPVFRVYGSSMTPLLDEGEVVVAMKTENIKQGDPLVFYYNNKVLIKRAIAKAGDWVDIDKNGAVSVNGKVLDEPYVSELSVGECDIDLPYQVPDGRWFVMGDHRNTSIDSRSTTVGCISPDQIVGIVKVRVWPINKIGVIKDGKQ